MAECDSERRARHKVGNGFPSVRVGLTNSYSLWRERSTGEAGKDTDQWDGDAKGNVEDV